MDPDLEVPVKLVPLHPLRQCQMWNCQKDILPYCSLSHQLLAVTEEDKAKAIVIVDGIDITEQERLAQKILAAKCVNEFTGVPRVPAIVLNHHNPWQVEQFESNMVAPESSRDWLYITENVKPGGIWRVYDSSIILGNTRTRYNMRPQPPNGSYKLHKYTRENYEGALFWMNYSGQGMWNQNNNREVTVVNTDEPNLNIGPSLSVGVKEKSCAKQDCSYKPGVLVKHTRLLERLPELVCRRGSYFQKNPSTYKLTIIPELDWKYFCEVGNNTDQSSSPVVIDLEMHSSPDDNMDVDAQQLILRASPEVLETSLATFLDTTDKVLANGMFSHSDRSPIAQLFEKSRLCIQSVKLHSERKGVTVNTHVIEPQGLVELFTMLSSGRGMGGIKDLLLVNLRGNDQIIVHAFKEYCGVDACIKMFKSYDGRPGASGSAPLAFLEDFIKGLILSARPLLPVEPFEIEFYYTMVERAAEVDEISYALMEKVDCLMQNLENMEVKIGEGCQLPDRDQAAVKADEADEVSYALMEKL